jgi:fatty-acyl-CoA synthase
MHVIWDIGKISTKRAIISPKQPALIIEDQTITYGELNERVNQTAHYLQHIGLKKGDRICVDLMNCFEFVYLYFAVAKLGLIFVPLNFRLVSRELEYQINNCNARFLAFHDEFMDHIEPIQGRLPLERNHLVFVKNRVSNGPDCPEWAVTFDQAVSSFPISDPLIEIPVYLDDPLAIIYTSGTTGRPKGVLLSHEQTYFKCFQNIISYDLRSEDRLLIQMPFFHSAGLFIYLTTIFCRGDAW